MAVRDITNLLFGGAISAPKSRVQRFEVVQSARCAFQSVAITSRPLFVQHLDPLLERALAAQDEFGGCSAPRTGAESAAGAVGVIRQTMVFHKRRSSSSLRTSLLEGWSDGGQVSSLFGSCNASANLNPHALQCRAYGWVMIDAHCGQCSSSFSPSLTQCRSVDRAGTARAQRGQSR
jgi:hypothetical protein